MRVLALVTDAFGGAGGIACYNRDLFGSLAMIESVRAIRVLPRYGEATIVDATVHQAKGRAGKVLYSAEAILDALRFRPDRIFCGHLHMLPLAGLIGRVTGIPVWLQLHGIEAWTSPSRAVAKALGQVDFVTCVSRYTRQRFLAWSNLDPSTVKVLPNTVSDRFVTSDREACRAVWDLGDRPVMLTVGRLATAERYKGHDRVLACLPALLGARPSLVYLVGGEGEDRARLEGLAKELGVPHAVRFLGAVANEELPLLFNAADLFVMPSTGEGFGIVYLEAMACGTPALGLDVDGSRDPLRDGEMGIVATEAGLCAAIGDALAIGRTERLPTQVQEAFGQAAFTRQVGALLEHLAGKRGGASCAA